MQKTERLQRVRALGLHLNHNKRMASEGHGCSTCGRALDSRTELPAFIQKQVLPLPSICTCFSS